MVYPPYSCGGTRGSGETRSGSIEKSKNGGLYSRQLRSQGAKFGLCSPGEFRAADSEPLLWLGREQTRPGRQCEGTTARGERVGGWNTKSRSFWRKAPDQIAVRRGGLKSGHKLFYFLLKVGLLRRKSGISKEVNFKEPSWLLHIIPGLRAHGRYSGSACRTSPQEQRRQPMQAVA